jgi:hypothetical protein
MPASGSRIRGFTNKVGLSFRKQTAFGTVPADLSEINKLVFPNAHLYPTRAITRNPQGGTAGLEYPARVHDVKRMTGLTGEFNLGKTIAGCVIPFAFGSNTLTGTNPSTNALKVQATNVLPVTSLIAWGVSATEGLDGSKILYRDMAVGGFSIRGSGSGESPIIISPNWVGSGNWAEDQTYTSPAVIKDAMMTMGKLTFKFGAAGTAEGSLADSSFQISDFDYTFANNMIDNHFPGGDLYALNSLCGPIRNHSLSFTAFHDGTDDLLDYFQASLGTLLGMFITCTAQDQANDYVKIKIPQFKIVSATNQTQGDHNAVRVETQILFDADSAGYTAGDLSGVTIDLKVNADHSPALLANFT